MIRLIKKLGVKPVVFILALMLTAAFAITYTGLLPSWSDIYTHLSIDEPYFPQSADELRATFFDAGNADCAMICTKDFTVISDTGAPVYNCELIDALKRADISNVDLMIISHADSDHIGNALKIMNELDVKRVIMPDCGDLDLSDYEIYNAVIEYADTNGIPVDFVHSGAVYNCGKIKITVLAPKVQLKSVNSNSVVFRLDYNKSSFLFTGDAETDEQRTLLDDDVLLKADIIKIPHHGRKSAFCKELLQSVQAKTAVITCGDITDYKVSPQLLMYLESQNTDCLRTDLNGNITIITTGRGDYSIETEK